MTWPATFGLFAMFIAICPCANADRKTVIKETRNGFAVVTTSWEHGKNRRWESEYLRPPSDRQTPVANILNSDRHSFYVVDLKARQYVEPNLTEPFLTLAMWLRRPPRAAPSGKTVHVHQETIDTGEERQMFGHTARHLIIREQAVAEPGSCMGSWTTERDGWYLPAGALSGSSQTAFLSGGPPCLDKIVFEGARTAPGFALEETQARTTRGHSDTQIHEVLELSDQPLDKRLFEPPAGFQRVDALPGEQTLNWRQRLQSDWQELERSLESWFE